MTTTAASTLPTPPSSPSPSPRKLIAVPIISTAALPTTLPLQPAKDVQALWQLRSLPAANVISTTSTGLTPLTTTTTTNPPITGDPPSRTLAAIKNDLHISVWRCGAQTLKKTECKRSIIHDNKDLIDAQLASMTGLTRASPDLESALVKLVMLVHCYQHDAGQPKERRLEAWTLTFPPGSADGSMPEVPVDRLIRKALEPLDAKCIVHGNEWVCKRRLGGWKVQNCERTIQELIKPETHSNNVKLEFLLKVLEWNRTCNFHQSSSQFTLVAAWKKSILAILPYPMPLDDRAPTSNAPNKPQASAKSQAHPPIATNALMTEKRADSVVQIVPTPQAPPSPTISLDGDPALYWPRAYDLSPFKFLAHAKHDVSPIHIRKLIGTEISRELVNDDLHDGYVYSYEVESNKGYVKIGYTTRPVQERHDEWSFDCNRQTRPLYPSPAQTAAPMSDAKEVATAPAVLVPHARRVEALCHAELDHRRIRIYCTACLKQHIEWFDVSAMEAAAIIQKWSRWMATQPYELLQLRFKSKWTLKVDEVRRTSRFDQFMQEIAETPAPLQKGRKD